MEQGLASDSGNVAVPPGEAARARLFSLASIDRLGRAWLRWAKVPGELLSFSLITLTVLVRKRKHAAAVVRPRIYDQVATAGIRLLPIAGFLAIALGFVVLGQTVALLTQVGAQAYVGNVMVVAVVRELGPLVTAMVVLMRTGTSTVIELGTARAMGEVEALEALGIDPIHYLVVPRVIGTAIAVMGLSSYLTLGALVSGYAFAFLQNIPITPNEYVRQLALALSWQDFVFLTMKCFSFGVVIAMVTCFQGLARPLDLGDISRSTTRALVGSLVLCVLLDALFILLFLVT